MSPNQYRALERLLRAGGSGLPLAPGNPAPDGTIHAATAHALERRGLLWTEETPGRTYAVISTAGVDLLATNPTGTPTNPGAPR